MKQLAWYTAVGLVTLAVVILIWEFRIALVLFILSLAVAAVLRPMVDYLAAHGLPRGLALVSTYIAIVAFIAALGLFLGGRIISEFQAIATALPETYTQLRTSLQGGTGFQQVIAQSLPDLNNLFPTITNGQNTQLIQNIMGMTLFYLDILSKTLIVFVLSIYWSSDQEHFKRLWLSLLPSESRARWREVWQNIEKETGAYLRSELIQSLLTVILLGAGYQLIGLKYPILLAVFAAVGWLFVWFGGLVAVIPAVLSGFSVSPATGLVAAIFTIAVLSFLEFFVEPKFFNRQRGSSLLVVIMVILMVKQFGIIGLITAPPTAAVIQILASQFIRPQKSSTITLAPPPIIQIDLLRERLNSVQSRITGQAEPPSPEIINLMNRLDKLIDRTHEEEQFTE